MKASLVNGGPHTNGNTARAPEEVAQDAEGLLTIFVR